MLESSMAQHAMHLDRRQHLVSPARAAFFVIRFLCPRSRSRALAVQ